MKKIFSILLFSLIPITACSSEPELAYDPVELIEYENCLTTAREKWEAQGIDGGSVERLSLLNCESKKPILK
jgi:photosystem II stability/assembly factor-like uncharacterized protein